jgi:hypothetical protein
MSFDAGPVRLENENSSPWSRAEVNAMAKNPKTTYRAKGDAHSENESDGHSTGINAFPFFDLFLTSRFHVATRALKQKARVIGHRKPSRCVSR